MTRDDVAHAKPEPDVFLAAADSSASPRTPASSSATAYGISSPPSGFRALGIGLLSGGYGRSELDRFRGAYRAYEDPAGLLAHLDEIGVRGA